MHRSRSVLPRELPRVLVAVAIAAALGIGSLLGAASASADNGPPTPIPTPTASSSTSSTLIYGVTINSSSTSAEGQTSTAVTHSDIVSVDCSAKPCVLAGFDVPVTVPGSTHATFPGHGTACGNDFSGAVTFDITINATGLNLIRDSAGSGLQDCGGGSSSEVWSTHETLVGTLLSGNQCLVGGPCPSASPVASSGPAAANSSGPRSFATPSILSTLPTAADAARPANLLWAAALTVILVLLIALPTSLLNSAVEHGTERLGAWRKRVWPALSRDAITAQATLPAAAAADAPASKPVAFSGWPLAAAGVLAASLISSFVDPSFGFNGASLRTFLSILVSFLLDAVAGWFLLIWLVRRAIPSATARFRFAPATLLIVVAAVLFTRLTGFQPGIVFGLVAGVAFGALVAAADKARNALIGLGYSFIVAIIGWIGYSMLAGVPHPNGFDVFVQETFSSMAIGGIAALPIALVPLRGLTGFTVFSWNRWAWAGAYAIGLFGFFFVLMPFPFAWKGVPLSIGTWVGIYLLYAVVAVVAWLVLARPWKKEPAEPEESAAATPESAI